jgi:ATP-binding protein involved in chromosome partitioning
MFEKLNVPIIGVVENMSHFICPNCDDKHYIFGEGGAKKISDQFNTPFLGEIPLHSGIMSGSDTGKPIMISNPDSPSSVAFRSTAKNIAAQCSILASKLQEEMASENKNDEAAPEASTN